MANDKKSPLMTSRLMTTETIFSPSNIFSMPLPLPLPLPAQSWPWHFILFLLLKEQASKNVEKLKRNGSLKKEVKIVHPISGYQQRSYLYVTKNITLGEKVREWNR
jgi:hypothetical protein